MHLVKISKLVYFGRKVKINVTLVPIFIHPQQLDPYAGRIVGRTVFWSIGLFVSTFIKIILPPGWIIRLGVMFNPSQER